MSGEFGSNEDNIKRRVYEKGDTEGSNIQVLSVDPVEAAKEEKKKIVVCPENQAIWDRQYIFPLLAIDKAKCKKEYGKEGFEKLFQRFKKMSDPSIPYKKVVTSVVRIRTLSNPDQKLGEYVYYLANLYGYQKHFNPETSEISQFESVHILNVPFFVDKKLNMSPDYQNGVFKGMKEGTEYSYFTLKFNRDVIDTIVDNSDMREGIYVRYSFKDMGKDYGGYTKDEISTLRADKLVSRNVKKEMGSDIRPEDQISGGETSFSENATIEETVPKKGKK